MNTTDPRPHETVSDAFGDTVTIIKRNDGAVTMNVNDSGTLAQLVGVKPADLRAALDKLYPVAEQPEAPAAPDVDFETACRFARVLAEAGHDHVSRTVPVGVLRSALREALTPRPGLVALREAVLGAGVSVSSGDLDALYVAGFRAPEQDADE